MNVPHQLPEKALDPLLQMWQEKADETEQSLRNLKKGPDSSASSVQSQISDWSKDKPPDLTTGGQRLKSTDSGYSSNSTKTYSVSSVSSGPVLCDVCPDTAVKRCLTCMSTYCQTHVREHYLSPDLQKHQLEDLKHHSICNEHHRKLELYCKTDQSPICLLCLLHNHRTHEVISQNLRWAPSETSIKEDGSPAVPPPGPIHFDSVRPDSVSLRWSPPEGSTGPHRFRVTWRGRQKQKSKPLTVEGLKLKVTELVPGEEYHFTVATLDKDNYQSPCVTGSVQTEVPAPQNLNVKLDSFSASLTWTTPSDMDQVSFLVELFKEQENIESIYRESPHYTITDLQPGEEYTIKVLAVLSSGLRSNPICKTLRTEIPFPEHLTLNSITGSYVNLSWTLPAEMEQIPHSFLVSYQSEGTEPESILSDIFSVTITGLTQGSDYTVTVYTQLQHGRKSQPASIQFTTGTSHFVDASTITVDHSLSIGRGSYGAVYRGTYQGTPAAVKIYTGDRSVITNEVLIPLRLSHPNIVRMMAVAKTETEILIANEYINGANLQQVLHTDTPIKLQYEDKLFVALDIAMAIDYIHEKRIIHQDLKPANIMVATDNRKAYLTDWGMANYMETMLSTGSGYYIEQYGLMGGTPVYMAPECLVDCEDCSSMSDMWSFGITLLEMFTNSIAWSYSTCQELKRFLLHRQAPHALAKLQSPADAIVKPLLEYEPRSRMTAKGLVTLLKSKVDLTKRYGHT